MTTKKLSSKKAFTLVELIIVIAIIAILAVTAFLLLTKRLAKARDASRSSNLANIENSLQISLTDNSSLPKPDSYTLIYASGTTNVIGYQGYFGEGVKDSVGNINSAPKDGDDYFTYYLNADLNKYQLASFMENEIAYNPNVVSAVDYASRYVNVKGDKLGLLTDGNKSPLQSLGLTGLDLLTGTASYVAYMDNSTSVAGTGKQLFTYYYNKTKSLLQNKDFAKNDSSLVFYSDMETTVDSGGTLVLKDFSQYGNNGIITGTLSIGNADGKSGKGTSFVKGPNYIYLHGGTFSNFPKDNSFTISFWMKATTFGNKYINIIDRDWYNNVLSGYSFVLGIDNYRMKDGIIYSTSNDSKVRYNIGQNGLMKYDSWNFVAFSLDKDKIKLYKDGTLIGISKTEGNFSTGTDIGFPYVAYTKNCTFTGELDEVHIYNRALSDDEVKTLYNATN